MTVAQDNFLYDNWKYLLAALAMHVAIGVLLTITISFGKRTVQPAQLAITAVMVDNTDKRLKREKAEAEQRAREEAEAERERQREEQRQEEARQEQERQQKAEQQRKEEEQRQATARKQRDAERRRAAEAKTAQAQKQKAEREAREQAQREAELKRQLAEETSRMAAVDAGVQAQYFAQIQAKIERNWSRPPTARQGISCELTVTQAAGGIVLNVDIGDCNGDKAVRESIETAVNKSSPLPTPSDSRLFARKLTLRFKPDQ